MSASGYTTYSSSRDDTPVEAKKALSVPSSRIRGGRDRPMINGPRGVGKESWLQLNQPPVKKERKKAISFVDSFKVEEVSVEDEELRDAVAMPNGMHNAFRRHSVDG